MAASITTGALRTPEVWEEVARQIGYHPYQYDLDDSSERLDVVQIVCVAIASRFGGATNEGGALRKALES